MPDRCPFLGPRWLGMALAVVLAVLALSAQAKEAQPASDDPQLEARVHGHRHDFAALARLPGRRVLLTNAPAAYTARVLGALGIAHWFDDVVTIEDMRMFGQWRPKPDRRMLRRLLARLRVPAARCVLVEDTLGHQKAARRLGNPPPVDPEVWEAAVAGATTAFQAGEGTLELRLR